MPSFEISVRRPKVSLDFAEGRPYSGTVEITVKNLLDRQAKVRVSVTASEPARAEWFAVDAEKSLESGATASFTVKMTIPAGTPPGECSFRPVAASVGDPSEESELGPPVTVTLGARRPRRWWIVAVAAGAVLVVAAVVVVAIWLIGGSKKRDKKPDGEPCQAAEECVSGRCRDKKCTSAECAADKDCPAAKRLCIRDVCQAPVANGRDCRENRECASGHCFHFACAPVDACLKDSDCKAPRTCNHQLCSLKALDESCANGPQCTSGRCVKNRCGDPLQCSGPRDCGSGICLYDWCRDRRLQRLQQIAAGSGRGARPGDAVEVRIVVHTAIPVPSTRQFVVSVRLGRTAPPAFTDVLLGLGVNGHRRLSPIPSPPPLPGVSASASMLPHMTADIFLLRFK